MEFPDTLMTVFSAELEGHNGTSTIDIPSRELDLGELDEGETYRIAIFETKRTNTDDEPTGVTPERQSAPTPPVKEGERYDVEIEDVGEKGDGIARVGPGYIVFVENTKIGDRVTVEITQTRENFAFGDVIQGEPITG